MSNRSAAASPATASEERWKIASRYAVRATPQTSHARLTQARLEAPPRDLLGGLDHLAELALEVGDLVAQPRGELELQLGGGGLHLVGEVLDELSEVGAGHAG